MRLSIERAAVDYSNWTELVRLLQAAFAPMERRIDPPSSVLRLTPESLAAKSREETRVPVAIDIWNWKHVHFDAEGALTNSDPL